MGYEVWDGPEVVTVWENFDALNADLGHPSRSKLDTFYLDEDSWAAIASDEYDARGQLYRTGFAYMAPSYDVPAPYTDMFGHYDLVARQYSLTGFIAETGGLRQTKPQSDRDWSPDTLAGAGIR